MSKYLILVSSLLLVACGSGSSNPAGTVAIPEIDDLDIPGVDNEAESILVTGDGEVLTINSNKKTNLTITGANHTINIETNVGSLSISGSNSLLRFSPNVTVDSCVINGSDNTAEKGENVSFVCSIQGAGNVGFE